MAIEVKTMTIVVPDNFVAINGEFHVVDCTSLAGIHAVQWYGNRGHVEYSHVDFVKASPTVLDRMDMFQHVVDEWCQAQEKSIQLKAAEEKRRADDQDRRRSQASNSRDDSHQG